MTREVTAERKTKQQQQRQAFEKKTLSLSHWRSTSPWLHSNSRLSDCSSFTDTSGISAKGGMYHYLGGFFCCVFFFLNRWRNWRKERWKFKVTQLVCGSAGNKGHVSHISISYTTHSPQSTTGKSRICLFILRNFHGVREKRQLVQTTVHLPPKDNLRNLSYLKGKVKYNSSLFWQIGIVSVIKSIW